MISQPNVYIVSNSITGMRYIGVRVAKNCKLSDIGNTYFTSSKVIAPLWKNDKSQFVVDTVIACDSVESALELEEFLIDETGAVQSTLWYNMANGGKSFNNIGRVVSEDEKERRRLSNIAAANRPDVKARKSASSKITHNKPEVKARKLEAFLKTASTPEFKKMKSDAAIKFHQNPETQRRLKATKNSPENKAQTSRITKALWASRPSIPCKDCDRTFKLQYHLSIHKCKGVLV